jgi:hypothetical protein
MARVGSVRVRALPLCMVVVCTLFISFSKIGIGRLAEYDSDVVYGPVVGQRNAG